MAGTAYAAAADWKQLRSSSGATDAHPLELAASVGLSDKYLHKGAVDLDKSLAEALTGRPVAIS